MAKSSKLTVYFLRNEGSAVEKVKQLQEEFPEIKIIDIRDDELLVYYDIKCPVTIRENLQLFLNKNQIGRI